MGKNEQQDDKNHNKKKKIQLNLEGKEMEMVNIQV